jgi:hypothetical protein
MVCVCVGACVRVWSCVCRAMAHHYSHICRDVLRLAALYNPEEDGTAHQCTSDQREWQRIMTTVPTATTHGGWDVRHRSTTRTDR